MKKNLSRKGYNEVRSHSGELISRHSEQQTTIEAAENAVEDGLDVWIKWADWDVVAKNGTPDPDTGTDPDPLPDVEIPSIGDPRETDEYALRQYGDWFGYRDQANLNAWMYDSVQALYELGIRAMNENILADARNSALAYVQDYDAGAYGVNWSGKSVLTNPIRNGDMKFTFVSPLYYLKAIEGIDPDPTLMDALSDSLWSMGWFGQSWGEFTPWSHWNERPAGYSLMGLQYLAQMGHTQSESRADQIIDWLHVHQAANGFWLHSYYGHEGAGAGETIGDATDVLCASPWMSCIIGGAVHRYNDWKSSDKAREILVRLAQGQIAALAQDAEWMISDNHSGYGCRYFVFTDHRDGSLVDPRWVEQNQLNNWYSDMHNPEVWHCIKAGGLEPPFDIAKFYSEDMLTRRREPQRLFSWQHSHYG